MAIKIALGALGAMMLVPAFPVHAKPAPAAASALDRVDFDLSAHGQGAASLEPAPVSIGARGNSIEPVTREQADAAAAGRALPDPPMVSYEPLARGPVIELGALGAKRDDMPGLVHFAVNWDF
jgi:hypothetical protein